MRNVSFGCFVLLNSTLLVGCELRDETKREQIGTSATRLTPSSPLACQVNADPTGVADATQAFNDAFDCSTKNALAQVVVPKGTFAITKKLTVPVGVPVVGDSAASIAATTAAAMAPYDTLPVLAFPGAFADDAIVLLDRASVSGLSITFASAQVAGKAAIRSEGIGSNVQKLRITNAGIGVYTPPEVNSGRIYVNQVAIYESLIGLWIDLGYDVSRFENVHVERAAVAPNTYGVIFGRNDYMLASKVSVVRTAVGAEFRDSVGNGGTLGSLTAYTSRGCTQGLSVKGVAKIAASNLTIDATSNALTVTDTAIFSASASRFASITGPAVALTGTGSLTISGSVIDRTDASSGDHGISVSGGRFLNVSGSTIGSNGHGVYFFAAPQRGVVAGNAFNMTNPSGRSVFGAFDANTVITGNGSNQ